MGLCKVFGPVAGSALNSFLRELQGKMYCPTGLRSMHILVALRDHLLGSVKKKKKGKENRTIIIIPGEGCAVSVLQGQDVIGKQPFKGHIKKPSCK